MLFPGSFFSPSGHEFARQQLACNRIIPPYFGGAGCAQGMLLIHGVAFLSMSSASLLQ
jgi:hypothetical protein